MRACARARARVCARVRVRVRVRMRVRVRVLVRLRGVRSVRLCVCVCVFLLAHIHSQITTMTEQQGTAVQGKRNNGENSFLVVKHASTSQPYDYNTADTALFLPCTSP